MLWRKKEKGLSLQEEAREQRTSGLARKEARRKEQKAGWIPQLSQTPSMQSLAHGSRMKPATHFKDERIRPSKGQSHQTSKCSVDAGGWGGVPEGFWKVVPSVYT